MQSPLRYRHELLAGAPTHSTRLFPDAYQAGPSAPQRYVPPTPSAGLFLDTPAIPHPYGLSSPTISAESRRDALPPGSVMAGASTSPRSGLDTISQRPTGSWNRQEGTRTLHHDRAAALPRQSIGVRKGENGMQVQGMVAARVQKYSVNLVDAPAPQRAVYRAGSTSRGVVPTMPKLLGAAGGGNGRSKGGSTGPGCGDVRQRLDGSRRIAEPSGNSVVIGSSSPCHTVRADLPDSRLKVDVPYRSEAQRHIGAPQSMHGARLLPAPPFTDTSRFALSVPAGQSAPKSRAHPPGLVPSPRLSSLHALHASPKTFHHGTGASPNRSSAADIDAATIRSSMAAHSAAGIRARPTGARRAVPHAPQEHMRQPADLTPRDIVAQIHPRLPQSNAAPTFSERSERISPSPFLHEVHHSGVPQYVQPVPVSNPTGVDGRGCEVGVIGQGQDRVLVRSERSANPFVAPCFPSYSPYARPSELACPPAASQRRPLPVAEGQGEDPGEVYTPIGVKDNGRGIYAAGEKSSAEAVQNLYPATGNRLQPPLIQPTPLGAHTSPHTIPIPGAHTPSNAPYPHSYQHQRATNAFRPSPDPAIPPTPSRFYPPEPSVIAPAVPYQHHATSTDMAAASMNRSASRPGGPRPKGQGQAVNRIPTVSPVAAPSRGLPLASAVLDTATRVQLASNTDSSSHQSDHRPSSFPLGAQDPLSPPLPTHPTLTRRAAISRHSQSQSSASSHRSYSHIPNATASAYSARPYAANANAHHRLSLVAKLSEVLDEAIADSTAAHGHGYLPDSERGAQEAGSAMRPERGPSVAEQGWIGAAYGSTGTLVDSPPQQSDQGYNVHDAPLPAIDVYKSSSLHPGYSQPDARTDSANTDVTLEWTWQREQSTLCRRMDPAKATWKEMEVKLGRRVNSAVDAERGEWVATEVYKPRKLPEEERVGLPRSPRLEGVSAFREAAKATPTPTPLAYTYDPVPVEIQSASRQHVYGLDGDIVGTRSPGEFSISDYLYANTPAVGGHDGLETVRPSPVPHKVAIYTPISMPTPSPIAANIQSRFAQPHASPYDDDYGRSRPILHVQTQLNAMSTVSPMTAGSHNAAFQDMPLPLPLPMEARQQPHPVVPPLRNVGVQQPVRAQVQRTQTVRSRHTAVGTSVVRVRHGNTRKGDHAGSGSISPTPVTTGTTSDKAFVRGEYGKYRSGNKSKSNLSTPLSLTRASTLNSAVYAPSTFTSRSVTGDTGPTSSTLHPAQDMLDYYNMDDSLFPVALSPQQYSPEELDHGWPASKVVPAAESTKRRKTGDGLESGNRTPRSPVLEEANEQAFKQGSEASAGMMTLRILREKTRKGKRTGYGRNQGISSADYVNQAPEEHDALHLEPSASRETYGEAVGPDAMGATVKGKRTRDGLSRLDTQIVHALRAFKSRASPLAPEGGGIGLTSTTASPDAVVMLGDSLDSARTPATLSPHPANNRSGINGNADAQSHRSGTSRKSATAMARWGSAALSRVVSRRKSKSGAKAKSPGKRLEEQERQSREIVNLDTPPVSKSNIASRPSPPPPAHLEYLYAPASPNSPVLITPPPPIPRPLPFSPPTKGLGLGVPIGLRSTYSLYNRPADLTLTDVGAGQVSPVTAPGAQIREEVNSPRKRALPTPPTITMPVHNVDPRQNGRDAYHREQPYQFPRSPVWPDLHRDAAQLLLVRDLDTGHACEVAMSRVEHALAALSR